MLVNPNILDNAYFPNVINQKGETSYTPSSTTNGMYSIDRWIINVNNTLNIVNGGVTVSCSTYFGAFGLGQRIESGEQYFGMPVVLSILVNNILYTTNDVLGTSWDGTSYCNVSLPFGNIRLLNSANKLLYFCMNVNSNTTTPIIQAVKFEIGYHQTLAHFEDNKWVINEIPNYEMELLRCLQYYQYNVRISDFINIGATAIDGWLSVKIAAPLIKNPICTFSYADFLYETTIIRNIKVTNVYFIGLFKNSCYVRFDFESQLANNIGNKNYFITGAIHLDANI